MPNSSDATNAFRRGRGAGGAPSDEFCCKPSDDSGSCRTATGENAGDEPRLPSLSPPMSTLTRQLWLTVHGAKRPTPCRCAQSIIGRRRMAREKTRRLKRSNVLRLKNMARPERLSLDVRVANCLRSPFEIECRRRKRSRFRIRATASWTLRFPRPD